MHVLVGESLGQLGVSSVECLTAASLSIGPTFLASSTNNHHDQNRDWQPLSKPKKMEEPKSALDAFEHMLAALREIPGDVHARRPRVIKFLKEHGHMRTKEATNKLKVITSVVCVDVYDEYRDDNNVLLAGFPEEYILLLIWKKVYGLVKMEFP